MNSQVLLTVSEFVGLVNQTLEYAYTNITVSGELANFRVSKNRWVYFDLKDEESSVKCFGTVYQLPGPLQDGMLLAVKGTPRLHPQYGFSLGILSLRPEGQGSLKKAASLLQAKLAAEGLFDAERKRSLPYPPRSIGLITSAESAAYRDFMKILHARWGGVNVTLVDVQVQGDPAVGHIVAAIEQCNQLPAPPEVLVLTRGGGSAEDLQAFSTEQVTRAIAVSRIPTLVAIGHEVDISLAELAADQRASTPSNAAELLVPDRRAVIKHLHMQQQHVERLVTQIFAGARSYHKTLATELFRLTRQRLDMAATVLQSRCELLEAYNPKQALDRGYALVRANGRLVRSGKKVRVGDELDVQLADSHITAVVKQVTIDS